MHELGLLHSVIASLDQAMGRHGARNVTAVGLRVGARSGAIPEALLGAWPFASTGTCAEGARLEIETVEAAVWCPACDAERPIDRFFGWTCPQCGTPTAHLIRGREFEVVWADLEVRAGSSDHATTA